MGPLPQFYRLVLAGIVLGLSLAGGIWLAGHVPLPLRGVGLGLAAGCLLVWVLSHDFAAGPRPVRVPRRR